MVELKAHQHDHFNRVCEILEESNVYIDASKPGLGKMIIAIALSLEFEIPLGVVAPVTVINTWAENIEKYGAQTAFLMSYESLRSTRHRQPKHGFLIREDVELPNGNLRTTFTPTEQLMQQIRNGVLVIFDESQKIKNESDQYKAACALTSACLRVGGRTRIGMLSGSFFDKEEHVINMLRMIRFIQRSRLCTRNFGGIQLLGAQDLIDVCNTYNPDKTLEVLTTTPYDLKTVAHLCYRLYIEVIQPEIVSAMPSETIEDIKNGYYRMDAESSQQLNVAISELGHASQFDVTTGTVRRKLTNYGAITSALASIERIKLSLFERLCREALDANPNGKVLVFMNFVASIQDLAESLKEYSPIVLYGDVEIRLRPELIKKFQQPDTEYRLLIANTRVGGVGIDLDDKDGRFPRTVFISTNYNIQDIHQATLRVSRIGTQSIAKIRCVYGETGMREMTILNALARKSQVLKETLVQQVSDGVKFPIDYPDEFEPRPQD